MMIIVISPGSHGQEHLAIAAGCDGTVSELPNKDWLLRSGWPLLLLCHFAGPGIGGAPEENGSTQISLQGQA